MAAGLRLPRKYIPEGGPAPGSRCAKVLWDKGLAGCDVALIRGMALAPFFGMAPRPYLWVVIS